MKKNKDKKFNCVEMKDQIQADLLKEYESKKKKFKSFADFLNAMSDQSPWQQALKQKIEKAQTKKSA